MTTRPAWHDQPVTVDGARWHLGWFFGQRLYHGSPRHLSAGTTLQPGHATNFPESPGTVVSVTSDPARAASWAADAAGDRPVHVYEIEPLGTVHAWRASPAVLWEGRVPQARIVRELDPGELTPISVDLSAWRRANPTRWRFPEPPPWTTTTSPAHPARTQELP